MESIFEKAFIQVMQDTLGVIPLRIESKLLEGYLSSTDITFEDGMRSAITFVSSKEFLGTLAYGLLGENISEDLELRDLSQELVNLTVGLAKVLAVKEEMQFNAAIPRAFGFGEFQDAQCRCLNFALDGAPCSLFMHT
ncbi:hypothetical protein [Helicobacter sp.]|uniref:hypothetical protein n=1 Tax=Helicobacter sp. TaxID=218 RepID=UPI0025BAF1A1|nr:hypothetical protein [Helicobacter sp.]MCI5969397.1 hypothetical protein [Helicobacter sp.]MDY2585652.1 hypothetical protein [Helicobacter sp.]